MILQYDVLCYVSCYVCHTFKAVALMYVCAFVVSWCSLTWCMNEFCVFMNVAPYCKYLHACASELPSFILTFYSASPLLVLSADWPLDATSTSAGLLRRRNFKSRYKLRTASQRFKTHKLPSHCFDANYMKTVEPVSLLFCHTSYV